MLDKRIPPLWESRPQEFHLAGEVLGLATGLIVHSHHVEERARAAGFEGPIWRDSASGLAGPRPRRPSGHEGSPLVGSFGNLNSSKRIPQLLEAFAAPAPRPARRRGCCSSARSRPASTSTARLQRLGLSSDGILREDYVDEARLWSLMAACDVCVNLRAPTMGETSGSVIRQLSLGKPVVVSDVGWFSELPDEVALKVPVGAGEAETLHAALELLAGNEAMRGRRCPAPRSSSPGASTTSSTSPSSTPPRSSRRPAARRSRPRCSATSPAAAADVGIEPGSRGGERARATPRRGRAWAIGCAASRRGRGSRASSPARSSFRAWLGSRMPAPFIFTDELQYQENARSLAAGEGIEVRDEPYGIVSVLYPLLLAPGVRRSSTRSRTRTRRRGRSTRS